MHATGTTRSMRLGPVPSRRRLRESLNRHRGRRRSRSLGALVWRGASFRKTRPSSPPPRRRARRATFSRNRDARTSPATFSRERHRRRRWWFSSHVSRVLECVRSETNPRARRRRRRRRFAGATRKAPSGNTRTRVETRPRRGTRPARRTPWRGLRPRARRPRATTRARRRRARRGRRRSRRRPARRARTPRRDPTPNASASTLRRSRRTRRSRRRSSSPGRRTSRTRTPSRTSSRRARRVGHAPVEARARRAVGKEASWSMRGNAAFFFGELRWGRRSRTFSLRSALV
mmetsp:Transcript_1385/g.5678  ORF Transcript_1385/g.5678 Transcript_1385/m.5678 type:complete len:289 (-) Transcript_1385:864-1730(-)